MFQHLNPQATMQATRSARIETTVYIETQAQHVLDPTTVVCYNMTCQIISHTRPWIFSSNRFSVFWTQSLDACVIHRLT